MKARRFDGLPERPGNLFETFTLGGFIVPPFTTGAGFDLSGRSAIR